MIDKETQLRLELAKQVAFLNQISYELDDIQNADDKLCLLWSATHSIFTALEPYRKV